MWDLLREIERTICFLGYGSGLWTVCCWCILQSILSFTKVLYWKGCFQNNCWSWSRPLRSVEKLFFLPYYPSREFRSCRKGYLIFRKETVLERLDANLIVTLCNRQQCSRQGFTMLKVAYLWVKSTGYTETIYPSQLTVTWIFSYQLKNTAFLFPEFIDVSFWPSRSLSKRYNTLEAPFTGHTQEAEIVSVTGGGCLPKWGNTKFVWEPGKKRILSKRP